MVKLPDLRRAVAGLSQGEVVVPALRTALNDPSFPEFTITVNGYDKPHKSSGRWSPSSHSTWNVRQLALYRMAPELIVRDPLNFTGTLAVTQGNFWHAFVAHVLAQSGDLLIDSEIRFIDEALQRSGYADGKLLVAGEEEIYELKTINSMAIKKIDSAAAVKREKYQYWCQVQEYLDVFGLKRGRIVFITPDYPFPMKEYIIESDYEHQAERREIYAKALEIANTGKLPLSKMSVPCCQNSEYCPVKRGC